MCHCRNKTFQTVTLITLAGGFRLGFSLQPLHDIQPISVKCEQTGSHLKMTINSCGAGGAFTARSHSQYLTTLDENVLVYSNYEHFTHFLQFSVPSTSPFSCAWLRTVLRFTPFLVRCVCNLNHAGPCSPSEGMPVLWIECYENAWIVYNSCQPSRKLQCWSFYSEKKVQCIAHIPEKTQTL